MSNDKTPMTDAMMRELSLDDRAGDPSWADLIRGLELEIKFGGGGLTAYVEIHDGSVDLCGYGVQVRSPEGPGGGGDSGIDTYEADVADMAAALRLVADALKPAGDAVSDSLQRVNASVEKYAADLRAEFGDSQYHIHWGAVFSRIGDIISQAEDDDKREKLSPDREKRALEIMTRAFHVATQIISDEADTGLEKLRGELLEQAEEETPDAPDK